MTTAIDHEARAMAAEAKLKIQAHEDRCAERWEESREALRELKSFISVSSRWGLGLLLCAMGSTIGMLVMMIAEHRK